MGGLGHRGSPKTSWKCIGIRILVRGSILAPGEFHTLVIIKIRCLRLSPINNDVVSLVPPGKHCHLLKLHIFDYFYVILSIFTKEYH